jgi:hypothetical protein
MSLQITEGKKQRTVSSLTAKNWKMQIFKNSKVMTAKVQDWYALKIGPYFSSVICLKSEFVQKFRTF